MGTDKLPNGANTKVLYVRMLEDGTEDILDLSDLRITAVKWEVESRQHQSRLTLTVMGADILVEEDINAGAREKLEALLVIADRQLQAKRKPKA